MKGVLRFLDLLFVIKNVYKRPKGYVYFYELIFACVAANCPTCSITAVLYRRVMREK